MSEDGISAYVLDESGNRQEIEAGADTQHGADDWDDVDERPGHHADGSRMWRFRPQADPRSWGDLTYIDNNIDEVKALGWIEDNPEGTFWTTEEAVQAYEAWAEQATEAYRTVIDENDQVHVDPYVPVAERPAAAPISVCVSVSRVRSAANATARRPFASTAATTAAASACEAP